MQLRTIFMGGISFSSTLAFSYQRAATEGISVNIYSLQKISLSYSFYVIVEIAMTS